MPQNTKDEPEVRPIIVISVDNRDRKRRKKTRGFSSRNARRLDEIEFRASKSLRRVTGAVDRGVERYLANRDTSKRKRRDGAIVDFVENAARGVSLSVSESAPVLIDLADLFMTNRRKRQIRGFVRSFPVRF